MSTSTSGIPDVMAIKEGRVVFVEVKKFDGKSAYNKLSEIQKYRISEIQNSGADVFVTDNLNTLIDELFRKG